MTLRVLAAPAVACLAVCLGAVVCFGQASPLNRIARAIDSRDTLALHGNVHPAARAQNDQGEVDGGMPLSRMTIFFKPTATQQTDLDTLLAQQQDRSSANYHRWLTPEEYGQRFGLSTDDLAKVTAWLQSQGFTVVETARGRNWVAFSGTANQVSAALRTRIHRYSVGGESHYANATEPFVPAALVDVIGGVRGLDDFRPRPRANPLANVSPRFTSGQTGRHFVTPGDFATIYDVSALYSNGIDGTGQKIAVMGQTNIDLTDIRAFRSAAGLAAKDPQVVLLGTGKISTGDLPEADLDVEWAGAVAKNATIIYVNSPSSASGVFDAMQSAISQNLAPVISISYGNCEANLGSSGANFLVGLAQQANTQGITIIAPAGDSGATDCDDTAPAMQGLAVDLPAGLPYVTGVGGTQFNEGSGTYWQAASSGQDVISSALSYIPEVSWNQTPASGSILATGGGASTMFSKPVWQKGTGVPNDGARDVPDVSFNAAPDPDGYLICSQGSCVNGFRDGSGGLNEIGGTSAGVPTFAGIVALINQQTQSAGQGNINYVLYPLATNTPSAFHDITSGGNKVACTSGTPNCPAGTVTIGFLATTGYDQVTGLGTPDVNNLVTAWTSISSTVLSLSGSGTAPDFQLALSPSKLPITRGSSGTSTITVIAENGFSGTPSFTCSVGTALTGVTCSVSAVNATTFTLRVSSTSGSLVQEFGRYRNFPPVPFALAALMILALGAGFLARTGGGRQRFAASLILVAVLAVAAGCGGGASSSSSNSSGSGNNSGASAGSVAVTATSGSLSHTAQISVTVN